MVNGKPVMEDKPIGDKVHPAAISAGEYPPMTWDEQSRLGLLWLCLSSGNYLHNLPGDTMPLPWEAPHRSLLAYGFHLEKTLSQDRPYIPVDLRFIRSTNLDLATLDDEMNRPQLRAAKQDRDVTAWNEEFQDRKTLLPDGFVSGVLQNRNWTNINGIQVPRSFSFKIFLPRKTGPFCQQQCIGEVTNITELSGASSYQPSIIAKLNVFDQRFQFRDSSRSLDYIAYNLGSGEAWLPKESPVLQEKFQAALQSKEAKRYSPSSVRKLRLTAIVALLSAGAILPLIYMLRAARNRK